MISGTDPCDVIQFQRCQMVNDIYLASLEDVILNKLCWGQRSQSEKTMARCPRSAEDPGQYSRFGLFRVLGQGIRGIREFSKGDR